MYEIQLIGNVRNFNREINVAIKYEYKYKTENNSFMQEFNLGKAKSGNKTITTKENHDSKIFALVF